MTYAEQDMRECVQTKCGYHCKGRDEEGMYRTLCVHTRHGSMCKDEQDMVCMHTEKGVMCDSMPTTSNREEDNKSDLKGMEPFQPLSKEDTKESLIECVTTKRGDVCKRTIQQFDCINNKYGSICSDDSDLAWCYRGSKGNLVCQKVDKDEM